MKREKKTKKQKIKIKCMYALLSTVFDSRPKGNNPAAYALPRQQFRGPESGPTYPKKAKS